MLISSFINRKVWVINIRQLLDPIVGRCQVMRPVPEEFLGYYLRILVVTISTHLENIFKDYLIFTDFLGRLNVRKCSFPIFSGCWVLLHIPAQVRVLCFGYTWAYPCHLAETSHISSPVYLYLTLPWSEQIRKFCGPWMSRSVRIYLHRWQNRQHYYLFHP